MAFVCSITNSITHPAMGGRQSKRRAGPFFLVKVANAAPPKVAQIWTKPKGMLSRIVLNLLKPNEFTIKGPKVVMPPEGILVVLENSIEGTWSKRAYEMEKINANQHQVLKSRQLSITCSHFHSVETTPIWLSLKRSTAKTLSWSLRNLASTGESGKKRLRLSITKLLFHDLW